MLWNTNERANWVISKIKPASIPSQKIFRGFMLTIKLIPKPNGIVKRIFPKTFRKFSPVS